MNSNKFKKKKQEEMRVVASKGRKAFRAKFKTKEELSAYMSSLAKRRKKK